VAIDDAAELAAHSGLTSSEATRAELPTAEHNTRGLWKPLRSCSSLDRIAACPVLAFLINAKDPLGRVRRNREPRSDPATFRLVSKNLGLELTHERHQILFFLMSQFSLKNHVKELDGIF